MPKLQAFLDRRRTGIGGSDAAAILGLDRYRSVHDVYRSKVERPDDELAYPSEAARWGELLEEIGRSEYNRITPDANARRAFRRSQRWPWAIASLDGWDPRRRVVLEVKTARSLADWGEAGSGDIPIYYRPQIQHYLAVTDALYADLVVLTWAQILPYRVHPDPEAIELLMEEERVIWQDHVVPRVPPPYDGSAGSNRALARAHPFDDGSEVVAMPHQYGTLSEYLWTRDAARRVEAHQAHLEGAIKQSIGDASALLGPGLRITWKRSRDQTVVDWQAVAEELDPPADVVSRHTSLRPGTRRLHVKVDDDSPLQLT